MFSAAPESIYEERQCFSAWFYITMVVPLSIIGNAVFFAQRAPQGRIILLLAIAGAFLFTMLLLNLNMLVTRIQPDQIEVTLGRWIPFFRKRIPLTRLHSCRPVQYHPLLEAGGWGIRFGRFEGARCWYYNTRGKEGVLLEGEKLRCIIGSQTPEQLASTILQCCARLYS